METLTLASDTRLLVLTGAGISAESGIPTFRDAGGLWEGNAVEEVASPQGFANDPVKVWRFYSQRRDGARDKQPNAGHRTLAAIEAQLGDRFLLATQNVDGLHRKAGSQRMIELHGNLFRSRCSVCDRPPIDDDESYPAGNVPACGRCAANGGFGVLRPDIVWFGEALDPSHLERVRTFMHDAPRGSLVFLAIGTSGVVYPSAGFARDARERYGAQTWLVNADPPANVGHFQHFVQGRAATVLPAMFAT